MCERVVTKGGGIKKSLQLCVYVFFNLVEVSL